MTASAFAGKAREMFWDLEEDEARRRQRAEVVRAIYALVDPNGWDASRMAGTLPPWLQQAPR